MFGRPLECGRAMKYATRVSPPGFSDSHRRRKKPREARSQRTSEDLLQGATGVLERMGAKHFTTNPVAVSTGVSIGSVAQDYPNTAVRLPELHPRDAHRLWQALRAQLFDATLSPRDRFEHVTRARLAAPPGPQDPHLALT